MEKKDVLLALRTTGIIPVIRADSVALALALAHALADGGVNTLEITMTVPNAVEVIRRLAKERQDVIVGAGTVLDAETARTCMLEGAQFVVSPALDVPTVEMCRRYSVAVLPGALTPTEIVTAWKAGADLIKVFPASAMGGAKYLRSLKAPLPHIELVPTGGVTLATAREFLEAGAFALGVGADLADAKAIAAGRAQDVTDLARKYLAIVREYRGEQQLGA